MSAWRRLPVLVRAVIVGALVAGGGTLPWSALAAANFRRSPALPWSVPLMTLYLCLYWSWLGGRGWPRATAAARRASLRARPLGARLWRASLLAGALGWSGLVALRIAFDALLRLPSEPLPDLSALPAAAVAAYVLMLALVAGVAEEAGFRGYMQAPLERRHGPRLAILVTSGVFWLGHATREAGDAFLLHAWFYLGASALYGFVAYRTGSILPCIALHAAGDVVGLVLQATLASRADGPERAALLCGACAAALVLLPAAAWACRGLARAAGERRSAPAVEPV